MRRFSSYGWASWGAAVLRPYEEMWRIDCEWRIEGGLKPAPTQFLVRSQVGSEESEGG